MLRKTLAIVTTAAAAFAVVNFNASTAEAAMAVDVTGGQSLIRGTWANYGYTITAKQPIRVSSLGLLDMGANGLTDPHDVGLWDSSGQLLATAIVNPNSPSSASVLNGVAWKFESITPLDLPAGTYKLSAFYRTTADAFLGSFNGTFATFNLDAALTYGSPFITGGGTESFVEPTTPVGPTLTPGFFGPNMQFTVIPEPASLGTIALLGGAFATRRRS